MAAPQGHFFWLIRENISMKYTSNKPCVAIIAGEASGDQHGAKLVRAMQKKQPELFFCGIGGPALRLSLIHI